MAYTKAQFQEDINYFNEMYEQLDAQGRFNDRLPNSGELYDEDDMLADINGYAEYIKKPESLSFWRN
jgi:hypothetical protein